MASRRLRRGRCRRGEAPGWPWAAAWDSGKRDREAGGGRDGGGRGLVYLGGLQRLDEDQRALAVADAAGGVAEDRAGLLCVAEQRAQGGEGLSAGCRQRPVAAVTIGGGDLAQVCVVPGPLQQQRVWTRLRFIRTVCSSRGRLRGPPWLRTRSQSRTSAAIGAGSSASLSRARVVKDGTRSSSRSPARARISAVRVMLRSRRCRAAGSWDQAIMSPGWHPASTTASARLVSVMIRSFQPRALLGLYGDAGLLQGRQDVEAAQWRFCRSSDSPGALSCSWVQADAACWAVPGKPPPGRPVAQAALAPARDSCQYPVPEVFGDEPAVTAECLLQPAQPKQSPDRDDPHSRAPPRVAVKS
jgi:hypothetical protein